MAIYLVLGTWERPGTLVFRVEIVIDLVYDAFNGPIPHNRGSIKLGV